MLVEPFQCETESAGGVLAIGRRFGHRGVDRFRHIETVGRARRPCFPLTPCCQQGHGVSGQRYQSQSFPRWRFILVRVERQYFHERFRPDARLFLQVPANPARYHAPRCRVGAAATLNNFTQPQRLARVAIAHGLASIGQGLHLRGDFISILAPRLARQERQLFGDLRSPIFRITTYAGAWKAAELGVVERSNTRRQSRHVWRKCSGCVGSDGRRRGRLQGEFAAGRQGVHNFERMRRFARGAALESGNRQIEREMRRRRPPGRLSAVTAASGHPLQRRQRPGLPGGSFTGSVRCGQWEARNWKYAFSDPSSST